MLHPAAVRCDMVLHQEFRARCGQTTAPAVRCDMVLHWAFRAKSKTFQCNTSPPQGVHIPVACTLEDPCKISKNDPSCLQSVLCNLFLKVLLENRLSENIIAKIL